MSGTAILTGCNKDSQIDIKVPSVVTLQVDKSYDSSLDKYVYTGNGIIVSNGGTSEVTAGFCYSLTNFFPAISDQQISSSSKTGPFSLRLPLESGQKKYFIRAFAQNKAGIAYGDTLSYITDCFTAPDAAMYYGMLFNIISPPDSSTELPSTVLFQWNAQNNRLFDVYLDKNTNPGTLVASGLKSTEFEISGLDRGTTYYWKVVMKVPSLSCAVFESKIYTFSTSF